MNRVISGKALAGPLAQERHGQANVGNRLMHGGQIESENDRISFMPSFSQISSPRIKFLAGER